MKKLFISLLFLLGTLVLYAQSDVNETTSDRAYMFRNMNLPQVETGILSDYGFNWFPPEAFNGDLNDPKGMTGYGYVLLAYQ